MRTRLIESERLFHNVVEHLPFGLLIKHLDGRYAYLNPRAREYVTSDALAARKAADPMASAMIPEILNQTDHNLLSPELAERIRAADETVFIKKRALREDYHGTVAESSRILSAVRFPVLDENQEVWRVATLLDDVTDQRQLERHAEHGHVELLADSQGVGVGGEAADDRVGVLACCPGLAHQPGAEAVEQSLHQTRLGPLVVAACHPGPTVIAGHHGRHVDL